MSIWIHRSCVLFLMLFVAISVFSQETYRTFYPNGSVKEQYLATVNGKDTLKHGRYTFFFKMADPIKPAILRTIC